MKVSQNWTPKFLRSLAEDAAREAKRDFGRNWFYSTCRHLAAHDALIALADLIENEPSVIDVDNSLAEKLLQQDSTA